MSALVYVVTEMDRDCHQHTIGVFTTLPLAKQKAEEVRSENSYEMTISTYFLNSDRWRELYCLDENGWKKY